MNAVINNFKDYLPPLPADTRGVAFWIGKLCLIAAVYFGYLSIELAYNLGKKFSTSSVVEDETTRTESKTAPSVLNKKPSRETYNNIISSSIFGSTKITSNATLPKQPPPSPLKLRLVAISEVSNGVRLAIIEDTQKQQQEVFETQENVFNQAKLIQILSESVHLERNGKIETLTLEELKTPSGAGGGASASDTQTEFSIPEQEVTTALANLPLLLSQARAVPYFRNGQSVGMRLFAIHGGSLYEKLGLKNGDIILSVNNNSLSDPTQSLKLFEDLKNERNIGVKLERNNETLDMRYSVR